MLLLGANVGSVFCFRVPGESRRLLGILVNEVSLSLDRCRHTCVFLRLQRRRVIPTDKLHKVQVL